jgi:hypothetical protein
VVGPSLRTPRCGRSLRITDGRWSRHDSYFVVLVDRRVDRRTPFAADRSNMWAWFCHRSLFDHVFPGMGHAERCGDGRAHPHNRILAGPIKNHNGCSCRVSWFGCGSVAIFRIKGSSQVPLYAEPSETANQLGNLGDGVRGAPTAYVFEAQQDGWLHVLAAQRSAPKSVEPLRLGHKTHRLHQRKRS